MAVFPSFNLTKKGEELLNRSIGEGRVLTFTKFKIGDGVPNGDWRELDNLQSNFKEFSVLETAIQADQVLRIRGYFDNEGFTTDKQFKEIGVFVTLDGVAGEHLYSYTNAGDTGDIIPAESRGFYSRTLDVNNYIGYATNITFNIEQTRDNYDFNTENELKVATFLKKGDKVRLWGRLVLGDIETLSYIVTDEVTSLTLNNGLYCKLAGDNRAFTVENDLINLKGAVVGDVVEVLGFHAKGDGSHHKRIAKSADDGSGEQGQSGIWWCLVEKNVLRVDDTKEISGLNIPAGFYVDFNGLRFFVSKASNVGFYDELHIRTKNDLCANFKLEESDMSWIIKKQNELVAKYLDLNARNEKVIITLQGDSITYGHDTTSADKVNPPTDILPDGSKHSATRSPRPINVSLQENLREIYGRNNIFVENRGYSGDWANRSYTKWRTPNGSNITLFLLGQNDQGGSWVPEDQRTYEAFYHWNLMLGIREILRGACVVFTDGYNNNSNNGGNVRATFMEMNSKIAETMGALFLETSTMLYGCNNSFFSDGVHLNTKGNNRMGARLVPFFVNKQMIDPVKINTNDYLGINTDFTQIRCTNGASLSYAAGSAGIITGSGGTAPVYTREMATLTSNERAIYSTFYLDGKSTILNILGGFIGAEVEIDFGNEQAYVEDDYTLDTYRFDEYNPLPPSFYEVASCELPSTGRPQATRIPILGKGWHTVRIRRQQNSTSTLYINGLKFIDRNELSTMYMDINNFKLAGEENNFNFAKSDYERRLLAAKTILEKLNAGRIFGRDKIIGKINGVNNYEVTHYGSGASTNFASCLTVRDSNYEIGDIKFYFAYDETDNSFNFRKVFDFSNDKIHINISFSNNALTDALNTNLEEILPKKCMTLVFAAGGQVQVYTYGTASSTSAETAVACYRYGQSFDGIIELYNYTHKSGVITFVSKGSIAPVKTFQALDTPYYTRKMEEEGIYADYVAYRDKLHEYENSQTAEETMLLPVLQEPVIPESVKAFAEKYNLI